jgi:hypothetical protein
MTTDTSEKGLETLIMRHMTGTTAYKLKIKRPGSGESREVNVDLLETLNWLIGREIVETLQGGDERAEYGRSLIDGLASRLAERFGRGFSTTNLRYFRTFHQVYAGRTPEIRHMACGESGSGTIRHTASGVLQDLSLAVEGQDAERSFSPALGWSHYRALMPRGRPIQTAGEAAASAPRGRRANVVASKRDA